VITYTYDECNRLSLQKVVDRNGTVIAQYQYTLGAGGERTKVTETGACGSVETAYDYDNAGRLIKETIQKGEETTTYKYGYDDVGNRIEKRENGVFTTYTYNSRNQLVTEETEAGVVTYSYDANGNLLSQSGAGKAVAYTYDVYIRLIQYAEGEKKENYTYDAEGVRRSKENGDETVYYISDTAGSLSYTLAETDKDGNVIATYNRADVLISQVRDETTSYYLFDGHGDVRALINEEGRISDKYRYNAYGELVERSGETENHYLYTGEYYDGTSNLYYLRARYMNPSTGTFISMDTYEGSIYDPDTLHKYLYANGNPVKYSDPSGNSFIGVASTLIVNTYCAVYNNFHTLNAMGMISGVSNMAIASFLGEKDLDIVKAFLVGYAGGFALSAVLCVSAAYGALALARVYLGISSANVIMSLIMLFVAVQDRNTRAMLVGGVLLVLSIITCCQVQDYYAKIMVCGNKGSVTLNVIGDDPENINLAHNSKSSLPQGVSKEKFSEASKLIRESVGSISDDIVVQGSRANGTAKATSDIDIAIRVSPEKFDVLIKQYFKTPNPGSAKERTMLHAMETGKIQAGEAKLSGLRKQLESILGMEVDISIIKEGGTFDNPPFISFD